MKTAGIIALVWLAGIWYADALGTWTEVTSFTIPKSPSGLFFYSAQGLLYVLCGTTTNGDHYIYAYTTGGEQRCMITIPQAERMARVDGFYIVGSLAYIVDSQGPIWNASRGGSVYAVNWSNPCDCSTDGTCASTSVTWSPSVQQTWIISASDSDISDGGGVDPYFRNSGIIVLGDYFYAVNGVHPYPNLTCCYPKSLVKMEMSGGAVAQKWSFDATTFGHDIDMEGLTCGPDNCTTYIYIGDEYNYIYKLNKGTSDPAAAVEMEWDINSAVKAAGDVPDDKGIESLTYAHTTGYFYAGIQWTGVIHVLELGTAEATDSALQPRWLCAFFLALIASVFL